MEDFTLCYAIILITVLPFLMGLLLFLIPESLKMTKGLLAIAVSAVSLYAAILLFGSVSSGSVAVEYSSNDMHPVNSWLFIPWDVAKYLSLNLDANARLIILFIAVFGLLVSLYAAGYMQKYSNLRHFQSLLLLTLAASAGAVAADNLIVFVGFWGFLGLTLYKMLTPFDDYSSAAAKKTLILIGGSDGLMILGIAIIWKIAGTLNMSMIDLDADNVLTATAFLCLAVGAFTKAGAFPFHTWVPDYTQNAAAPVSAYLPASLDKLLGIYFLARICKDIFSLPGWIRLVILTLGALTIIIAVMMALVQHNYKKLLGYHAVSQVGYMIIGIGLGSVLGLVGGLFHMVNNALYKSGLFLAAGSVQQSTGKDNLDDLGGLSRSMPVTFICSLIFALSISGIPPLNGFASKWIIYQGIIDFGKGSGIENQLWIVWLSFAVIGSALTLASFIKFVSGIFLGGEKRGFEGIRETNWVMWTPILVLAMICVGFGVFASKWVIPIFFEPVAGSITYVGIWDSATISLLILISILLGIIFYFLFSMKKFRTAESFIGGETIREEAGFESTSFYETIRNSGFFKPLYEWADRKYFDIYEISKDIVLRISNLFSAAHTGILSNFAFWVLAGLIFMFIFLLM
jgi:multicomponent Na+:H+ antiporter subunit A